MKFKKILIISNLVILAGCATIKDPAIMCPYPPAELLKKSTPPKELK